MMPLDEYTLQIRLVLQARGYDETNARRLFRRVVVWTTDRDERWDDAQHRTWIEQRAMLDAVDYCWQHGGWIDRPTLTWEQLDGETEQWVPRDWR